MRPRRFWALCLLGIIGLGILSRAVHTGFAVFDKYLGDALYAAMVYVILRLLATAKPWLLASVIMLGLELFQLTGIPAQMVASDPIPLRVLGALLGSQFNALDLLAYGVGIASVYVMERQAKTPARCA